MGRNEFCAARAAFVPIFFAFLQTTIEAHFFFAFLISAYYNTICIMIMFINTFSIAAVGSFATLTLTYIYAAVFTVNCIAVLASAPHAVWAIRQITFIASQVHGEKKSFDTCILSKRYTHQFFITSQISQDEGW